MVPCFHLTGECVVAQLSDEPGGLSVLAELIFAPCRTHRPQEVHNLLEVHPLWLLPWHFLSVFLRVGAVLLCGLWMVVALPATHCTSCRSLGLSVWRSLRRSLPFNVFRGNGGTGVAGSGVWCQGVPGLRHIDVESSSDTPIAADPDRCQ